MRAKVILYLLPFAFSLFAAEPSIFGVPEKEKKEQEEFRKKIQKEIHTLSTAVKQLKEIQSGMQSLFDSQSKKVQELYTKNQKSPFATQNEMQESFKDLNSTLIANFRTYDESFESLKKGLESLGGLIEALNNNQKKEINHLLDRLDKIEEKLEQEKEAHIKELENIKTNQNKDNTKEKGASESTITKIDKEEKTLKETPIASDHNATQVKQQDLTETQKNSDQKDISKFAEKEIKKEEPKQEDGLESLPNSVVYRDGIDFFKKGELEQAKRYLERSVENGYKPATSIYYLGEIAYQQKRFEDAIKHYKDSATRYDKAVYIPTLLLHTAISFQELDDKANAKMFLDTLVGSYPNSKEAKEAKNILKKIK